MRSWDHKARKSRSISCENCGKQFDVLDSGNDRSAEQTLIKSRNWERINGDVYCPCCYRDGEATDGRSNSPVPL